MPNIGYLRTLLLGTENSDGSVTGVTTGTSQPIRVPGYGALTVYLRSVGVTTGGTILIEEADWGDLEAPYSGTWVSNTSVAANTFTGGAQSASRLTTGAYRYVRVRISATITGGGTILASIAGQSAGG